MAIKKKNLNLERILLIVSIVIFILMLILTVYNFIFFPALLNSFAIVLFAICYILRNSKSEETNIYMAVIFGVGLALIVFSTVYTIISLLI